MLGLRAERYPLSAIRYPLSAQPI